MHRPDGGELLCAGDLAVYRSWWPDPALLPTLRECFSYDPPTSDRATGYLFHDGTLAWPAALAGHGVELLSALQDRLGVTFPVVALQAYRHGSGCGWHADTSFGAQAILSLGASRTFAVRRTGTTGVSAETVLGHGDLAVMPDGFQSKWEHCVPEEDVTGERCSLVFRVPV